MAYYVDEQGQQVYYDDGSAIQTSPQPSGQLQQVQNRMPTRGELQAPGPGVMHRWETSTQSISIIPLTPGGSINIANYANHSLGHAQAQPVSLPALPAPAPQYSAQPVRYEPAYQQEVRSAVSSVAPWKIMLASAAAMLLVVWVSGMRDQNIRLEGKQEMTQQVLPYLQR